MSYSITALQLLNQVSGLRRIKIVGEFERRVTLDAINRAKSEVLAVKRWEFDTRSDQITLKKRREDVNVVIEAGAEGGFMSVADPDFGREDVIGDFILRVIPEGVDGLSDTAIRVISASSPLVTFSNFSTASRIPVEVNTSTGSLVYSEYLLPDNVASVTQVMHQEEMLTLDQAGARSEFSERFASGHIQDGPPRVVSVGGLERSTYETGTEPPSERMKMAIWPVPDEDYVLDFTYDVHHPDLVLDTDKLEGVSTEVIHLIVSLAASDMQTNFDRRSEEGRAMRRDTLRSLEEVHDRHSGLTADRAVIRNWDTGHRSTGRDSLHSHRLIGRNELL